MVSRPRPVGPDDPRQGCKKAGCQPALHCLLQNVAIVRILFSPAPLLPRSPALCYNPPMTDPQAETIHHILTTYRTVAVVGFSDRDRRKAAFYAPAYLKGHGYTILPINPRLTTGLNRPAYPTLADAPGPIDVALIYAAGARVGPLVDEAIAAGAKAVWLPIGVVDEVAAARARAAGLLVVMDRCMMVEHKHLEI